MTTQSLLSRFSSKLLINHNYALLWSGQAVSSLGDSIYDLTLTVWIVAVIARQPNGQPAAWAPLAVSGVLLAVALPSLFFGPVAGVFVDRWNKKPTMLRADLLRMFLVLCLLLVSGLSFLPWRPGMTVQLSAIYTTVFLTSICSQFFTPARAALLVDIVDKKQFGRASGLAQIAQSMASILGPPLAAPVLFGFGLQWALLFNALTFLVSFLCIQTIQAPVTKSTSQEIQMNFGREFLEGINFSFKNNVLQVLLIVVVVASLGAGAINALMIFFVTQNLHINVTYVGLLDGAFGIGIIVGAILMSVLANKVKLTQMFTCAILGFGILFLLLARTSYLPVALPILLCLGLTQAMLNVTLVPIALSVLPQKMVGRFVGTLNPLGVLASLISVSLAGYLASGLLRNFHTSFLGFSFGPIDTIFTLSALLFLVSGLYALIRLHITPTATPLEEGAALSTE
jgi:MFS family permease